MSKLLVLGAGNSQVDLIRCAKDMGMEVFVLGGKAGEPGEKLGDHFAQVDIRDEEAIYQYAKETDIDFIFTLGMEMALPIIARVSERLDLPHFFDAQLFTDLLANKARWRKQLEGVEGNLAMATADRVEDFADWTDYPAVIKPVDGSGQRGVHKVDSYADVQACFDHAQSFSKAGPVMIEPYAAGDEISVNAYFEESQLAFALISDRYPFTDLPGGIINHHVVPSRYDRGGALGEGGAVADKILRMVREVGQRMGFQQGHVYYQIKVDQGQPQLIEFTPRFDGCHMWNLIFHATGLNLVQVSLEWLRDGRSGTMAAYQNRPIQGVWRTQFISLPPGTIFHAADYAIPADIDQLFWYYQEGQAVKKVTGYMEKAGYYICHDATMPDQAENLFFTPGHGERSDHDETASQGEKPGHGEA